MNVIQFFEKLSYGPYSNLHMGGEGSGAIDEQRYSQVISYLNDGLIKLYTKFLLLEKDVLVEMNELTTNYHLIRRYARSNEESPTPAHRRYILDLPEEPFTEDVAKILSVYNTYGIELPLNDREHSLSVFTPQPKLLQVPRPYAGLALAIHYQALHPKIVVENLEAEIFIPDVLDEALLAYVAYKTYSDMNTENSTVKAQEHFSLYNSICSEVLDRDLVSSAVSTTNSRFQKRGWV
jgi:hypothetical protein